MNNRIKLLAKQADIHFSKSGTLDAGPNGIAKFVLYADLEKFAELIVAECMNLAEAEQKRYASITHRNMSECAVAMGNFSLLMEEHFGVEE